MAAGRGDGGGSGAAGLTAHPVYALWEMPVGVARPAGHLLSLSRAPARPGLPPASLRAIPQPPLLRERVAAVVRAVASLDGLVVLPWVAESDQGLDRLLATGIGDGPLRDRAAVVMRVAAYLAHRVAEVRACHLRVAVVGHPLLATGHVRHMGLDGRDLVLLAPVTGVPNARYLGQLARLRGSGGASVLWGQMTRPEQVAAAIRAGIALGSGPVFGAEDWRHVPIGDPAGGISPSAAAGTR